MKTFTRRIAPLALTAALAFGATACGDTEDDGDTEVEVEDDGDTEDSEMESDMEEDGDDTEE